MLVGGKAGHILPNFSENGHRSTGPNPWNTHEQLPCLFKRMQTLVNLSLQLLKCRVNEVNMGEQMLE